MTAPSIRQLIADVAHKERRFREVIGVEPNYEDYQLAEALLASPLVQELLAAADRGRRGLSPEARALLDDYALSIWSEPDDR